MKILYLSPWFPAPPDTGSRTRVYYLARELAKHHKLTLLSLDPKGWQPPDQSAMANLCELCAVVPRDPFHRSILVRATRFASKRPIISRPFPEMMSLTKELHEETLFDVVISGTIIMAEYALALDNTARVLEEHNSMSRWMSENYRSQRNNLERVRRWVSWQKSVLYERNLFRKFDLISMVSEADAAYARELMPGREAVVKIIPNGVDTNLFRNESVQSVPNRLIFGGSLDYTANLEAMRFFLAEIFPRIRDREPRAHLIITGSSTNVDLKTLKVDNQVTLSGFVDDIGLEIARASVAIVPILSGGGTRIKILEAMASGTPVVATRKGAEGLNIENGKNILLADKPDEFADMVLQLFAEEPLRQALKKNALKLVEMEYDWGIITSSFSESIRSFVEKSKSVAS